MKWYNKDVAMIKSMMLISLFRIFLFTDLDRLVKG